MRYFRENPELTEITPLDFDRIERAAILAGVDPVFAVLESIENEVDQLPAQ